MTADPMSATPVLELRDVAKRFGGIAALSSASLVLPTSTVLALVGENGAGKSTLIKIVSGVQGQDEGEVLVDGVPVRFTTPQDATAAGIATVYQELSLLPGLSLAENLVLGTYPKRSGIIDWRRTRREAAELLDELGLRLRPTTLVADLSLAERYLVEIAKAVRHRPRVLILDEPTAALDPEDSRRIFDLMETLRRGGTSMIFVSHRLDELFITSQAYMVMKDGATVGAGAIADTSEAELVRQMLGGATPERTRSATATREASATTSPIVLTARAAASPSVQGVDLVARKGEIIGVAGLRGSGQTELCRLLAGVDPLVAGDMEVDGRTYAPRGARQAMDRGVVYLPQERKSQGLFLNLNVAQNVAVAPMVTGRIRWASRRTQERLATDYRERLDMRLPAGRVDTPVGALSGGNQQKVVLARCLAAGPTVLVLDEPTRGVDVGAKQQIHDLIRAQAAEGMCVIVSSSELSELLALCSRLLVLHRGDVVVTLAGDDMQETTILSHASGVSDGATSDRRDAS
ncbi:sugar ABC transporter ATP-binding protein [Amnibacterium sp.]|uniref:sugar ABC transporter ATP-binding protein n=1 Tax=Amnibacterium sp. TaxID=1872496 RepID=UPI00263763F2|nr:sugar ABC transporter ATP-binding protein [Amnibacterium sp.]MCU1474617.1 transporter related protein (Precursor) [Amnibacterium sp.]